MGAIVFVFYFDKSCANQKQIPHFTHL